MAHFDTGFTGRMPNPARFRLSSPMLAPPASDFMNARILLPGVPAGGGPTPLAAVSSSSMSQQQQQQIVMDQNFGSFGEMSDENTKTLLNTNNNNTSNNSNNKFKEKTPMCLIAELVRYNKLTHQYKLINESGPAHQKSFAVSLILQEGEEYVAEGPSIKKAQQAAARKALECTKLPRPPSNRMPRKRPPPLTGKDFGLQTFAAPTVALNELAIKMNLVPEYANLTPPALCNPPPFIRPPPLPPPHQMFSFNNQPRLMRPRLFFPPPLHAVCLKIGQFEFYGRGLTRQLARHDAAAKAVRVLKEVYEKSSTTTTTESTISSNNSLTAFNNNNNNSSSENCSAIASEEHRLRQIDEFFAESSAELKENNENKRDLKSPISVIHELALQKKMDVNFEVVSETGPAHNREFVIRLTLLNDCKMLITEGQGPCKKRAKHNASEKMIEELKKIADCTSTSNTTSSSMDGVGGLSNVHHRQRIKIPKEKKRKTIIKDVKMDPNYGQQINPISRLVQIQQAKKEAEPVFTLVNEIGQARYKEYVMQVCVGEKSCQGTGPNKKLAKRAAAEVMLDILGFTKPLPKPGKPVLKHQSSFTDELVSSTTTDDISSTSSSILLSQIQNQNYNADEINCNNENNNKNVADQCNNNNIATTSGNGGKRRVTFNLREVAASTSSNNGHSSNNDNAGFGNNNNVHPGKLGRQIAPGLLFISGQQQMNSSALFLAGINQDNNQTQIGHFSHTNTNNNNVGNDSKNVFQHLCPPAIGDAKQQLMYLSSLLKFQIQFTDFPKTLREGGNGGEYLSLISLGVNPSQVFHGSGSTVDSAQNEAAAAALRYLSEKGLDNVVTKSQQMSCSEEER